MDKIRKIIFFLYGSMYVIANVFDSWFSHILGFFFAFNKGFSFFYTLNLYFFWFGYPFLALIKSLFLVWFPLLNLPFPLLIKRYYNVLDIREVNL